MKGRTRFPWRPAEDPGAAWTEALLEPLRGEAFDCSVAPAVMARIAAERLPARPLPALLAKPRLLWAACVPVGIAAFGFLSAVGLSLLRSGTDAAAQRGMFATLLWRLLSLAAGRIAAGGGFLARLIAPFLRGAWTLVEILSPVLRGAGLVAATTGLMSLIISIYVFSHDRGTAPHKGAASGFPLHGGTR